MSNNGIIKGEICLREREWNNHKVRAPINTESTSEPLRFRDAFAIVTIHAAGDGSVGDFLHPYKLEVVVNYSTSPIT